MYRDVSICNTYNYGDSVYWDARYVQEAGPFDWYQRYSALRPLVRSYISTSARVLMVGCGNAARPEFQKASGSSSSRSLIEPVPITDDGRLPVDFVLEDPDSHFIYFCRKMDETEPGCASTY